MIQNYCKENLLQLATLLESMPHEVYVHQSALLSDASIGQHMRHVLEFYICLLDGLPAASVNYDNRKRDISIELSVTTAHTTIAAICSNLDRITSDASITLCGNFSSNTEVENQMMSSIFRELAYCLEHSIHHQALIKVGLIAQQKALILSENFGVAPATIRNQKICVQ